jgi:hypothetical protein
MPGLNDPMVGGLVTSGGARPTGGGTGAGVHTDDGIDIVGGGKFNGGLMKPVGGGNEGGTAFATVDVLFVAV